MRFIRWIPLLLASTAFADMPPANPPPNQPLPPSGQSQPPPLTHQECERLRHLIEGRGGLNDQAIEVMNEEDQLRHDLKAQVLALGDFYKAIGYAPHAGIGAMHGMQATLQLMHDQLAQIEDAERRGQALWKQIQSIRADVSRACPGMHVDATPGGRPERKGA